MGKKKQIIYLTFIMALLALFMFISNMDNDGNNGKSDIRKEILTSEELVKESLEAYGGIDKIGVLEKIRLKNSITVYGTNQDQVNGTSIEHYNFPDMVRVDFEFGPEKITHMYNGLEAWTIMGGKAAKAPDFLAESLRRSVKHFPSTLLMTALDERSLLGPIIPYSTTKKSLYSLELTDREGDQSKIWFNAETLLMERIEYIVYSSLGADTLSIVMSEYRETDGIQTAFEATIYYNGSKAQETSIEEVDYSSNVPDSLFAINPIVE
jgi:hypothetical protein